MKVVYFFALVFTQITSCDQLGDIKDPIAGEYIYTGETEFSKGSDTLHITSYDKKTGIYIILRTTGFNRIIDGHPQPKEFKSEKFTANYDEKKHQLEDTKTGRLFSFNNRNELLLGTATYRKIK